MKRFVLGFICAAMMCTLLGEVSAQPRSTEKLGVVNGRAIILPEPRYPLEARKYCADGRVEIEVVFNRKGKVTEARGRTGDELLIPAAVDAAKRARFRTIHEQPARTVGILVYNFKCPWPCIRVGVPVNNRALSIPKPDLQSIDHQNFLQMKNDETPVDVEIVVAPDGNVISARATAGHTLITAQLVRSASGVKFSPTPASVYVRAFIRYVVKRNGDVTY